MSTKNKNLAKLVTNGAFVVDSNGNIGIANTTSTIGAKLQIEDPVAQAALDPVLVVGDSGGSVQAADLADGILVDSQKYGLAQKRHNDTNSALGVMTFRSRGTSGAETVVDNFDNLGTFSAMGYTGSEYKVAGYFAFQVDEAVRSLSGTNIPSQFFIVLNDGTTYNTPFQILPSATAGYSQTIINGSATINGSTGAAGITINSNGSAYTAVTAIANNNTCQAQLANDTYTFVGQGGAFVQTGNATTHAATFNSSAAAWAAVYAIANNDTCTVQLATDTNTFLGVGGKMTQTGPSNNYAATFSSESTTFGAVLCYSEDDGVLTRLGYNNKYTVYGTGGEIINYGDSNTSSDYSFRAKNAGGSDLFTVRNDGRIQTGAQTASPYSNALTNPRKILYVDQNGNLGYDGSSEKIKENIVDMDAAWADKLLDLRPVNYQLIGRTHNDWNEYGLIAEEVGAVDPRYVYWDTGARPEVEEERDAEGNVIRTAQPAIPKKPQSEWVAEGIEYPRLVPGLISIAQRQRDRIEALEARVAALENK